MLRSGLFLISGNGVTSLMLLARNLTVAALIPVADYGVAASFAIVMALIEMAMSFGLHQQIIQARDADARLQAGLQGFQLARGIAAGLILFAVASPLAAFLGVPDMAWAYRVLALVPVLNALHHLDMHKMTRDMRFGPLVLSQLIPAGVGLLLVWPLAVWLGDARVMLWVMIVQVALTVILTHAFATARYQITWDRGVIAQSLRFGWPLLANAVLLFAVFQGDKIIVGRMMGVEALAIFAMGMTLTLTPTLVMAKSAQSYLLPQLSKATGPRFRILKARAHYASLIMGAVLVLAVIIVGPWLVETLLGAKYVALVPLLVPMAVMQALRVAKAGPAIIALSVAKTHLAMWPNLVRIAALPVVWVMAQNGASLVSLIYVGIVAEALGYLAALWGVARIHKDDAI